MRPHRHLGELLILFGQGTEGLAVIFGDGLVRLFQHLARFFPEIIRIVRRWCGVFVCHGLRPKEKPRKITPAGLSCAVPKV